MSKEINQDTIERYLKQQLEGEELSAFKSRMDSDAEFKKEVEFQSLLFRGANKYGEDEMRSSLKNIRAEIMKEEGGSAGTETNESAKVVSLDQRRKPMSIFKWGVAAALVLTVGAALFMLTRDTTLSNDDLYATYYQPYSESINVRNASAETVVSQASQLYQAKNYKEALPLFLQALEIEPGNAELQLSTGICHLELNQLDEAMSLFNNVGNPLFMDQAKWYRAMVGLKIGDKKTKLLLESIKPGEYKYDEAKAILAKWQ